MVIYTEFLYVSVPGKILSVKWKTIAYVTQLTSLNTCVLHHGYIYRISVCFSSRYNSEYQTRNYSTYITQLTAPNACVLHHMHGCIYRISVSFSSKYNSELQTKNYSAYMTQLTSLNTCVLHLVIYAEFLYISVPGIILSIKPKTIAYMTKLTSLNTCVLHHGYIYRISVCFSSRYNSELQTKNYSAYMTQLTSLNTCVLHLVIYAEFLYISVPGIILSIKPKTIAYMTQLTSLNTCVLHHGYIYRISVCFSSRYNYEFQTRNYIAYMTQSTSLNTCVLHHGYICRISVYFSSRYNSKYQTKKLLHIWPS